MKIFTRLLGTVTLFMFLISCSTVESENIENAENEFPDTTFINNIKNKEIKNNLGTKFTWGSLSEDGLTFTVADDNTHTFTLISTSNSSIGEYSDPNGERLILTTKKGVLGSYQNKAMIYSVTFNTIVPDPIDPTDPIPPKPIIPNPSLNQNFMNNVKNKELLSPTNVFFGQLSADGSIFIVLVGSNFHSYTLTSTPNSFTGKYTSEDLVITITTADGNTGRYQNGVIDENVILR